MKKTDEILDLNKLQEIVVVANTPLYLFSNFQKNESVLYLFSTFSDQELIKEFHSELANKRSLRNLAILYAIVIAIYYTDSAYADDFFKNLHGSQDLKWAKDLAEIYFSKTSYSSVETNTVLMPSYYDSKEASMSDTIKFNF